MSQKLHRQHFLWLLLRFYCTEIHLPHINVGLFNHSFLPFAWIHLFRPTSPAYLNNIQDPIIFFLYGGQIEERMLGPGEKLLDVQNVSHNDTKSLHDFYLFIFPQLYCKMLPDMLHVLINSIGHQLPLPTTASIAGASS